MGHHHQHQHQHVVEPIYREQKNTLVLSEKGLQSFFAEDFSHIEKRAYQFSATERALAGGKIYIGEALLKQGHEGNQDNLPLSAWVKMAVINGVKQAVFATPALCSSNIEQIKARMMIDHQQKCIEVYCYVSAFSNRAVETEALAGVNAGLLTIYDHFKCTNPAIAFGEVQLYFKEDGQEGLWFNPQGMPDAIRGIFTPPAQLLKGIQAVVVSVSDKAVAGSLADAGELLKQRLEEQGATVIDYQLMPSDENKMIDYVTNIVKEKNPHLVMLRGTVGISPYDKTPFATKAICERMIPGLGELLRIYGSRYTSGAWNACCEAGVLNRSLIISLPGARKAIDEVMQILPVTLADAISHLQETSLASDHADEVDIACRIWT